MAINRKAMREAAERRRQRNRESGSGEQEAAQAKQPDELHNTLAPDLIDRLVKASNEIFRRTIRSKGPILLMPEPKFAVGDMVRLDSPESLSGWIGRIESFQRSNTALGWLYVVVLNAHREDKWLHTRELLPEEYLARISLLEIIATEAQG